MQSTDILIVGGGIIGLATAYQLTRQYPGRRVVLLEKEAELASHQSGATPACCTRAFTIALARCGRKTAAPEKWRWSSSARPKELRTRSAAR